MDEHDGTLPTSAGGHEPPASVRRFFLARAGRDDDPWASSADRCAIGSHPSNDIALDDPTVSRFHCEIRVDRHGARIRDLGSRNGTRVDGLRVVDAFLRRGSTIRVGHTELRFEVGEQSNVLDVSPRDRFGELVGRSVPMRAAFRALERAAKSDATVLIEGETGTGKGAAARSLHAESARAQEPFVVVDCAAAPLQLFESHLFGHARGAFTGALEARAGAFEAADGGVLFLDEIGELPLPLQASLLRVVQEREIRRVGETRVRRVDVRLVAATNRELRREVSAGHFREDLYYRLAVVRVEMPPLRSRPEDLDPLVREIVAELSIDDLTRGRLLDPPFIASLRRSAWPGNVRELRNYLVRSAIFDDGPPAIPADVSDLARLIDPTSTYAEAKERMLSLFERSYAAAVVDYHGGNVSKAARAAGIARSYLHRLLRRHGVR